MHKKHGLARNRKTARHEVSLSPRKTTTVLRGVEVLRSTVLCAVCLCRVGNGPEDRSAGAPGIEAKVCNEEYPVGAYSDRRQR